MPPASVFTKVPRRIASWNGAFPGLDRRKTVDVSPDRGERLGAEGSGLGFREGAGGSVAEARVAATGASTRGLFARGQGTRLALGRPA